jgi:hypothetical protein
MAKRPTEDRDFIPGIAQDDAINRLGGSDAIRDDDGACAPSQAGRRMRSGALKGEV